MTVRQRIHPAWVVLGAVTLCMMAGSGLRSVFGVYIKPMEAEFGWGRGALSGAAAISLLLLGAAGPVVGQLIVIPLATGLTLAFGWRMSFLWQGVGLLVLVLPIAVWLMGDGPAERGLRPYGATGPLETAAQAAAAQKAQRVSVLDALGVPQCWVR